MKNFFKYSMLIVIVLSCFFALLGCDTPADPTPTLCEHDYEGHVAIEATCDQDGAMLYSCQLCGDIYSETIPATGHSYSDDWSWDDDSHWHNANCEHTDLKDDYDFHDWDDGEVITAPGCTTDGTKLYTCEICGAYRTEPISATGHTYGTTWEHDQDSHWLCATCQHDTEIGSEGAHDWEEVRVLVAPTCLNEGVMLWQCSVCERPDERPIEATGHSYSEEYSSNVEKHWLESTCGCDVVDEEADHSFDRNGLCTVCNASRVYSVGLQFTLSPDGEYYVLSGRGTCEEQDIIVPATYKDLPVKAVADGAFENDYNIITLSLPGSIEVIGQSAFEDARMLESVTLSEGLLNVKDSAFRGATIREIVIPDSVTTIGEYAFANISYESMDVATIGSGVTSIGEFAFIARTVNYNAIEVTEYERAFVDVETINVGQYVRVLPDNFCNSGEELEHVNFYANSELERIGEKAFLYCVKLYHIEIPAGVTYIGEMAFADCAKLIDVKNDSSVTARIGETDAGSLAKYARNLYSSTYGATKLVYNGDFVTYEDGDDKIFIAYHGTDTSVTIPDGTTEIYHYAMLYSDVQEIIIPDGVTKIDASAFSRCYALTEVSIPDTVTEIGGGMHRQIRSHRKEGSHRKGTPGMD